MKTFALIVYVMNAGGGITSFAAATDMTETECMTLLVEWGQTVDQYTGLDCEAS